MKKITALLGPSHSEFDKQLKDTLNDIVDAIEQLTIGASQKLSLNKNANVTESQACDLCKNKAAFTVIDNSENTYKFFCNNCLGA